MAEPGQKASHCNHSCTGRNNAPLRQFFLVFDKLHKAQHKKSQKQRNQYILSRRVPQFSRYGQVIWYFGKHRKEKQTPSIFFPVFCMQKSLYKQKRKERKCCPSGRTHTVIEHFPSDHLSIGKQGKICSHVAFQNNSSNMIYCHRNGCYPFQHISSKKLILCFDYRLLFILHKSYSFLSAD